MNLAEVAERIGARILNPERAREVDVDRVHAGDRMSDLLSHVSDTTLLVTHIANHGLVRLIELMDAPGICLVNGAAPDQLVEEAARRCGTVLLVSPASLFETCGRLHRCLGAGGEGAAAR
ncbi:MAG TPA: hypothetical protein PKI11_05220 [Candidatus Hydrogenedentes bacterium]|nr:hypothetical protein [Candidatus Hydrogenedentota bacterium]